MRINTAENIENQIFISRLIHRRGGGGGDGQGHSNCLYPELVVRRLNHLVKQNLVSLHRTQLHWLGEWHRDLGTVAVGTLSR